MKLSETQSRRITLTGFSDEAAEDFSQQLACMKEFGIEFIELRSADKVNVADFTPEKTAEIYKQLKGAGVQVSSIGSPIGKISVNDPFEPHFEAFQRTVETAHALRAPYIRMFSFYIPKGEKAEKFKETVFQRLHRLKEYAEKEEITLLHENEKGIYGDTGLRCQELMKELYSPRFKAVFDFANFVECGEDTWECYTLLKPYIEYIHIKDVSREKGMVVPAGCGDGQVKRILQALKEEGFSGFLSLEPHLTNFAGLQALEQNAKKRESTLSQKEAWRLALDSLKRILNDLNWEVQPQ